MKHNSRKKSSWLLLVVMMAIILAACSGGGDSTAASLTAAASSAASGSVDVDELREQLLADVLEELGVTDDEELSDIVAILVHDEIEASSVEIADVVGQELIENQRFVGEIADAVQDSPRYIDACGCSDELTVHVVVEDTDTVVASAPAVSASETTAVTVAPATTAAPATTRAPATTAAPATTTIVAECSITVSGDPTVETAWFHVDTNFPVTDQWAWTVWSSADPAKNIELGGLGVSMIDWAPDSVHVGHTIRFGFGPVSGSTVTPLCRTSVTPTADATPAPVATTQAPVVTTQAPATTAAPTVTVAPTTTVAARYRVDLSSGGGQVCATLQENSGNGWSTSSAGSHWNVFSSAEAPAKRDAIEPEGNGQNPYCWGSSWINEAQTITFQARTDHGGLARSSIPLS